MHLLVRDAAIFALSLLSSLKSFSHISEEYCNTIVTYCVFELLLWGDFNKNNPAFFCLVFVQKSNREQRHIFVV